MTHNAGIKQIEDCCFDRKNTQRLDIKLGSFRSTDSKCAEWRSTPADPHKFVQIYEPRCAAKFVAASDWFLFSFGTFRKKEKATDRIILVEIEKETNTWKTYLKL